MKHPPPDFRTDAYRRLARELHDYPWIGRCGDTTPFDSPFAVRWAGSLTTAQAACTGPFWSRVSLDAQNALSLFLLKAAPQRRERWNEIVQAAHDEVLAPLWAGALDARIDDVGLGPRVQSCIRHDLTMALLSRAFDDLEDGPRFFEQKLAVYRAGHFPCGWYLGRPPQGVLLVW